MRIEWSLSEADDDWLDKAVAKRKSQIAMIYNVNGRILIIEYVQVQNPL